MKIVRMSVLSLLLMALSVLACSSTSDNSSGNTGPAYNRLYFVSTRFFPNNSQLDGDIFSVPMGGGSITNLSGGGTGDNDDYPCAVDVNRGRMFFVSERTDIGNTAGDLDVFEVPTIGGVIVNLTDGDAGDRDDACLGLTRTGDVVFESARLTDNAGGDLDIFVATLTFDRFGNVTGATLSNRTEESAGTEVADRLVAIGGDVLYFESPRTGPDDSAAAIANPDEDMHIFSASISGARHIVNLTADDDAGGASGTIAITGTTVGAGAQHMDLFCGLDAGETQLAFMSTRNQGVNGSVTGSQISGDWDVFVRDLTVTTPVLTGGAANSAMANLTDAGSDTNSTTVPQDDNDFCAFGPGFNAVTSATGTNLVLFVSGRTGAGTHRSDGDGTLLTTLSQVTNLPAQGDTADVFASTMSITPASGVLNTITNLTDGTLGDDVDVPVGVCSTRLLFESPRTDLASTSSGTEDDIYAVDLSGASAPVNLTDGDAGDDNDVFVCCNAAATRIAFASARTDVGNDHGPTGDIDIFTTALGDTAGTITDMTDSADGDDFDGFGSIGPSMKVFTGGSGNPAAAGGTLANAAMLVVNGLGVFPNSGFDVPASTSTPAVTGSPQFTGFSYGQNYFVGGIGYGPLTIACSNTDQIVWGSRRTQPLNSDNTAHSDLDIFAATFFTASGAPTTSQDIRNLTDAGSDLDADDGIVGLDGNALPDAALH